MLEYPYTVLSHIFETMTVSFASKYRVISPACAGRSNGRNFMWYVYILKSSLKRWYYVGSTNRLEARLKEHNGGKVTSTKSYKPLEMIFKIEFATEKEARSYEKLLKDKRIEKERIIKQIESV